MPQPTEAFDVFLSHNSRDTTVVADLARRLRACDLKVWFDKDCLLPGQPWLPELEKVITSVRAAAVLWGENGLGPWQDFEMQGCLIRCLEQGLRVIPVILPGVVDRPKLPLFLEALNWVDLRGDFPTDQMFALVQAITGESPERVQVRIAGQRRARGATHKRVAATLVVLHSTRDTDDARALTAFLDRELRPAWRGRISSRSDRRLARDGQPDPQFRKTLEQAGIIVYVLSASFLESDLWKRLHDPADGDRFNATRFAVLVGDRMSADAWDRLRDVPVLPFEATWPYDDRERERRFRELAMELADFVTSSLGRPHCYPKPARVFLRHLPTTGTVLVGRDRQVADLESCWYDRRIRIIVLKGGAGTGKTALLNHWLARLRNDRFRGARSVLTWSFFSQTKVGNEASAAQSTRAFQLSSVDEFVETAYEHLGGRTQARRRASPWAAGEQIADWIAGGKDPQTPQRPPGDVEHSQFRPPRRYGLIVLDAVEVLQSPEGHDRGRIVEPVVQSLCESLIRHSEGDGLCVMTTREEAPEWKLGHDHVKVIDLDTTPLAPSAGRDLLRAAHLSGKPGELEWVSRRCGNFPFALHLLAAHLHRSRGVATGAGRPLAITACRKEIQAIASSKPLGDSQRSGAKARGTRTARGQLIAGATGGMTSRDLPHLVEGILTRLDGLLSVEEHWLLQFLALFEGPLDVEKAKAICRRSRESNGANETDVVSRLRLVPDGEWTRIVDSLRTVRLLGPSARQERIDAAEATPHHSGNNGNGRAGARGTPPDFLEVHPLVRGHFRNQLPPKAWQDSQQVVYDYYWKPFATWIDRDAPRHPKSLAQLTRLVSCIVHGCAAGLDKDVWDDAFWTLMRGGFDHVSGNELGCWSIDRAALSRFFRRQWRSPSPLLEPLQSALALNEAAYDLRSLGELHASVRPARASIQAFSRLNERTGVAIAAGNLAKIFVPLGGLQQAVQCARRSVAAADRGAKTGKRRTRSGPGAGADRDIFEPRRHWSIATRVWLADVLRWRGSFVQSGRVFTQAEHLSKRIRKRSLVGSECFRHCQLLLDDVNNEALRAIRNADIHRLMEEPLQEEAGFMSRFEQVRTRIGRARQQQPSRRGRLDDALYAMAVGRSSLLEGMFFIAKRDQAEVSIKSPRVAAATREMWHKWAPRQAEHAIHPLQLAKRELERAVDALERHGHQIYLVQAYVLLCAACRDLAVAKHGAGQGGSAIHQLFEQAERNLQQVWRLTTRDGMRLFEAEAELTSARLRHARHQFTLDAGDLSEGIRSVMNAAALAKELGYGRRHLEIEILLRLMMPEASRRSAGGPFTVRH